MGNDAVSLCGRGFMSEELKPCPFCSEQCTLHCEEKDNWQVHCDYCPAMMIVLPTKEEAIEAWNKRA